MIDEKLVKKLYVEEKHNLTKVSEITGFNRWHIYSFLKKNNLIRGWKESQKYRKLKSDGFEKDIEKLYLIDKKSVKSISYILNIPETTIARFINKNGWMRNLKESLKYRPPVSKKTRILLSKKLKGGNVTSFKVGHKTWCKGLTKDTSDLVRIIGEKVSLFRIKNGLGSKEKNPNWKGGITPFKVSFTNRREYKQLVRSVFERDGFKCKICGGRGTRLEAHHIKPFAKYPDGREDKDNLITLCKECHTKTFQKEEKFIKFFNELQWQTQQ